jgi:hypothetical protein
MKRPGGKAGFVVAVLAASCMLFAADAFGKAGRGATVIVTLKSGVQVSGELIHVRPASILILATSGRDESFDLREISSVWVFRRSKALQGVLIGLLTGAGGGLVAGTAVYNRNHPDESLGARAALFCGGAFAGLIAGGIVGGVAGKDLLIRVDGIPPPALGESLRKLSKYARIKGSA